MKHIYIPLKEYVVLRSNLIFSSRDDRKTLIYNRFGLMLNFIVFPKNCILLVLDTGDQVGIFPKKG